MVGDDYRGTSRAAPRSNQCLLSILGVSWALFFCCSFPLLASLHKESQNHLVLPPQNFSESIHNPHDGALNTSSASKFAETIEPIETILIIATVPYDAEHAMALWTHLECLTSGIDRVLISAPDTAWSRDIIESVVKRFQRLLQESSNTTINIDTAFYTNNRYDVGLWCDGLSLHLGFDGHRFLDGDTANATQPARAIFLINDSSAALGRYESLTKRIVTAAQIEQQQQQNSSQHVEGTGNNLKLVSLNGNLIEPGRERKWFWIESVYRGLTPSAVSRFYEHSCTPRARRLCVGKIGNDKKKCIVNWFEKDLLRSFSPSEVDAMYPSYLPKEWDPSGWEETGGPIGPYDQWIRGSRFFFYLYEEYSFPLRKLKWPDLGMRKNKPPPPSNCLELLGGSSYWYELKRLSYPSPEAFEAFQEEMLKSESTLN